MSGCGAEHGLISIDQALALIAQTVKPLAHELVPVEQALQHVLAEEVNAPVDLPIFSQSAVDGYALAAAQHLIETEQSFQVIGEIRAGQVSNVILEAGQAVRIFTGGKIPEGTTTVARQEIVDSTWNSRSNSPKIWLNMPIFEMQAKKYRQGKCSLHKDSLWVLGRLLHCAWQVCNGFQFIAKPKLRWW